MQASATTRKIGVLLLSAIVLMFMALYDGFPILTSDSGTYITSGFSATVPVDRPIFYGLFIRYTSLGLSVWLTIFVQCLLLADSLIYLLRNTIKKISGAHLLAFVFFVSVFTIGGWYAGQLMADIFVAILILNVVSLVLYPQSKLRCCYQLCIIFICALVHNSNLLSLLVFSCIVLFASIMRRKWILEKKIIILLLSLSIVSWFTAATTNWIGGNGFSTSKSTHVFVMGKLVESGVLKTYLDKACPTKNYKICAYKDSLPPVAWEFHWDASSPLQKTGGWETNREEYNTIIKNIFSKPHYYPFIAYKAIEATARQLTLYNIDGTYRLSWMKFDEGTTPYEAIKQYFPHELNQLKASQQNQKTIDIGFWDNLFLIVIVCSIISFLLLYPSFKTVRTELVNTFSILILFMILNAFVTATLSSVNSRFNSRVIWLIPFFCGIYIYKLISLRFEIAREKGHCSVIATD